MVLPINDLSSRYVYFRERERERESPFHDGKGGWDNKEHFWVTLVPGENAENSSY